MICLVGHVFGAWIVLARSCFAVVVAVVVALDWRVDVSICRSHRSPCLFLFSCQELESSNAKVRGSALVVLGEFHSQLGRSFRAVSLSMCSDAHRKAIEDTYEKHPFDEAVEEQHRPRKSIFLQTTTSTSNGALSSQSTTMNEVPSGPASRQSQPKSNPMRKTKKAQTAVATASTPRRTSARTPTQDPAAQSAPAVDDAVTAVSTLGIKRWDAHEDDDGVLAGLKCKSKFVFK